MPKRPLTALPLVEQPATLIGVRAADEAASDRAGPDKEETMRNHMITTIAASLIVFIVLAGGAVTLWMHWFGRDGGTVDGWLQAQASLYGGGLGVLGSVISGAIGGLIGGWLALRASERAVQLQVQEAEKERQREAVVAAEERAMVAKERQEDERHRSQAVLRALQAECRAVGELVDPEEGVLYTGMGAIPHEPITLTTLPAALPLLIEMPPPWDEAFFATLKAQQALVRLNAASAYAVAVLDPRGPGTTRQEGIEEQALEQVTREATKAKDALCAGCRALAELLPVLPE